jgi:hypothetical protein
MPPTNQPATNAALRCRWIRRPRYSQTRSKTGASTTRNCRSRGSRHSGARMRGSLLRRLLSDGLIRVLCI